MPSIFDSLVVPSVARSGLFAFVGAPFSGKTTSALTFQNPLVLNGDNKLPSGIKSIDLWNPAVADKIVQRRLPKIPSTADALLETLETYAPTLPVDTTLIIDSLTIFMNFFDREYEILEKLQPVGKSGEQDHRWFWAQKLSYMTKLMAALGSIPCTKIVLFHETGERNEKGTLTGKLRPVLDGSFKDKILAFFTEAFRQVVEPKKNPQGLKIIPEEQEYLWQVRSDSIFNARSSQLYTFPPAVTHIKATYGELMKYKTNVAPSGAQPSPTQGKVQ